MANYQIPMTGAQITDALTQLVNRVAEGWAVGSRDGNPVSSGSPYYHNNAKYYCENAQDAAARAEAAVPASTAGAVFFDRSQSLTDAQKGQAKSNIGAGSTNPNLLDNPWFTVNQRGFTSTSSNSTYTVDRWIAQNMRTNGVCSYSNGIMTLDATAASQYLTFGQNFDTDILGRTVTLSIMEADGSVYSASGVVPATRTSADRSVVIVDGTAESLYLYLKASTSPFSLAVQFRILAGRTVSIKAVKLELGSVSTLANDAPPNYEEELAKCQRYFQRINGSAAYMFVGFGVADTTTAADIFIPLPATMRGATPTITTSGTIRVKGQSGTHATSAIAFKSQGTNGIKVSATSGSMTTNEFLVLQLDASAYIDLSADL